MGKLQSPISPSGVPELSLVGSEIAVQSDLANTLKKVSGLAMG